MPSPSDELAFQRRTSPLSSEMSNVRLFTNVSETRHRGTRFRKGEKRDREIFHVDRVAEILGQTGDQDRSTFSTSTCREIPRRFVAASQLRVKDHSNVLVESSLKSCDTRFTDVNIGRISKGSELLPCKYWKDLEGQ